MKLVYYVLWSVIAISLFSGSIEPVQAMFSNEIATIWYNPSTTSPKKRFPALDKWPSPITSSTSTTKTTTSTSTSSNKANTTTSTSTKHAKVSQTTHEAATITVDVREAASEQQARIQSVQWVKTPQVALIDTTTIDISSPEYPAIDSTPAQETLAVSTDSSIIYLNDRQYVDEEKVRQTWLQWTNDLRNELGRTPYSIDRRLNSTATARSKWAANIGSISHRRRSGDSYYNYNRIVQWFKDTGNEIVWQPIEFRNVGRATFSESIGRGMYSCRVADCTQDMIDATRSTWNFFYSERAANGVHYRALTHPRFALQWLWLWYTSNKYYLTIHYGTEILED